MLGVALPFGLATPTFIIEPFLFVSERLRAVFAAVLSYAVHEAIDGGGVNVAADDPRAFDIERCINR